MSHEGMTDNRGGSEPGHLESPGRSAGTLLALAL